MDCFVETCLEDQAKCQTRILKKLYCLIFPLTLFKIQEITTLLFRIQVLRWIKSVPSGFTIDPLMNPNLLLTNSAIVIARLCKDNCLRWVAERPEPGQGYQSGEEKRTQWIIDDVLANRWVDLCRTVRIYDNRNEYLDKGTKGIRDEMVEVAALIP